jgi:hypothetical protein
LDVLQLGDPGEHLAAEEAVGAAQVRLALRVEGVGLLLRPLQADAAELGDAVDEDRLVLVQRRRVAELFATAAS